MAKQYTHAWIPGNYYAAVRYANKMIRETGWFNRAIETASDYYNVDEEELKEYVVNWRKECNAAKKAEQQDTDEPYYKWYIVISDTTTVTMREYESPCWSIDVKRSKSFDNLKNKLAEEDYRYVMQHDWLDTLCYSYIWNEGFSSKKEAEKTKEKVELPTSWSVEDCSGWI